MERHFEYPARIEQDSAGFYLVTFPDFPEAATDARSVDAAIAEGIDCLEEAVAGRMKRGEDIPAPSQLEEGMVAITLPALYAMKAALYLALRERQLSRSALAAKLGKDEKEVERLLDPAHTSRISALEAALHAIGKRVQVVLADLR
jgi:antitoxin HicB